MRKVIDINCDLGEGLGNEAQLMPYISSCNIACGGHAGDRKTMSTTIKLALKHQVKIGAHPSFPDIPNFGRKVMDIAPKELQLSIEHQIMQLMACIDQLGATLHHVKAHGALYNLVATDIETAQILLTAVKNTANDIPIYAPYNSVIAKLAKEQNLDVIVEAFGDRSYNDDLTLVSRTLENAVLIDKEKVLSHLLQMILKNEVMTINGVGVKMEAKTYCIHGDNPNAIMVLKHLEKELEKRDIKIA